MTGSWDTTVKLWEVSSGSLIHTLEGHQDSVTSVSFSSDGKYLVTGSWIIRPNFGGIERNVDTHLMVMKVMFQQFRSVLMESMS